MSERSDVRFRSGDADCAAWLYLPEGPGPHPAVVLEHGLGAVKEMRLDAYAERFTAAGYACLVFDHRHFGASGGQPRQLLSVSRQLADWKAAIGYVRGRPDRVGCPTSRSATPTRWRLRGPRSGTSARPRSGRCCAARSATSTSTRAGSRSGSSGRSWSSCGDTYRCRREQRVGGGGSMTRYVALGDSTVEGLEDPGPDGVYVGWADRLARHLAAVHPDLTYANLAVRGLTAGEVRETQLEAAVALRPDIAVVVAGVNDVLRPRFDRLALRDHLFAMHEALRDTGARVATFTMPDMAQVAPLAVALRGRLATLNDITLEAADVYGSVVADLAAEPLASDPALWHDDRLHANSEGHRRVALALAEALGVEAGDWREPLPHAAPPRLPVVVVRELAWVAGHLAPWLWGRILRRRPEAPPGCKRPELLPVD